MVEQQSQQQNNNINTAALQHKFTAATNYFNTNELQHH